jgi:hypothetical protein
LRLKNSSKTKSQPQQQQQQTKNKTQKNQNSNSSKNNDNSNTVSTPQKAQQKLISKTQIQADDEPSPSKVPGQVRILSRAPTTPNSNTTATAAPKPSTQGTPNKPLNFADTLKQSPSSHQLHSSSPHKSNNPSQQYTPAKGRAPPNLYNNSSLAKSSSFATAPAAPSTPSVPASTSEQAPAASLVPIPFGLTPTKIESKSRNALLNALNAEKSPSSAVKATTNGQDILSTLMASVPASSNNSLNNLGRLFSKFLFLVWEYPKF